MTAQTCAVCGAPVVIVWRCYDCIMANRLPSVQPAEPAEKPEVKPVGNLHDLMQWISREGSS